MSEEQKIKIKSLLEDNQQIVTEDNKTLSIADKLNWFKPIIGREYNVKIEDDTIMYVNFNSPENTFENKKQTKDTNTSKVSTKPTQKYFKDDSKSIFENLRHIQCKIEKKGQFNYVSWTDAWEQVKNMYPTANFKIHTRDDGFPAFIDQQAGGFVKVSITIEDLTHTEYYPVTNNMNKAISSESIKVDDINNSIKRCLVKCLAFFGLGLYVYKGEDLPSED